MLYAKLNKAMQPAFIKMMSKYGKAIAVSVISIVVCAGIGVGGYWAYNYYLGAPTNESGAEAKPTPNEGIILNPPVASLNLTKPGINTVVLNLEDEIVLSLDGLGLPADSVKKQLELLEEVERKGTPNLPGAVSEDKEDKPPASNEDMKQEDKVKEVEPEKVKDKVAASTPTLQN